MPVKEDIGKAYANYYTHSSKSNDAEEFLAAFVYGVLGLLAERRSSRVLYLDQFPPGRLLEIGFGDASRLQRFRALGWEVEGQEVDPVAVANAKRAGFVVHHGALPDLRLGSGSYDAIAGAHVLEHVHAPLELLQECHRLLKPCGRLVMVVPNVESFAHKQFGAAWRGLEPPRHLALYSSRTSQRLFEKAGFEGLEIRTSMSHAAAVINASLKLASRCRESPKISSSIPRPLRAMKQLLAARYRYLRNKNCGEELVITAMR